MSSSSTHSLFVDLAFPFASRLSSLASALLPSCLCVVLRCVAVVSDGFGIVLLSLVIAGSPSPGAHAAQPREHAPRGQSYVRMVSSACAHRRCLH